ncbi:MAG: SDR family oxidoreductase [Polyangiales bacterium]
MAVSKISSSSDRLALVTGGAGFIGSHVVRALVGDGWRVRVMCLPGDDARNLAGLEVERFVGDVTDLESVRRAVTGARRVFHLAALYALWVRDPSRLHAVNVDGTRNVLRAAREAGVERVVHTSSIARFGGQGADHRATEASPFALGSTGDLYSQSKYVSHELAVSAAQDGQDVVIVAPTAPIGPGDTGPTPTGRLLVDTLTMPIAVVADTASNFGDVRDIAKGHLLAADKSIRGESYLLGNEDWTMAEVSAICLAIVGIRRPIVRAPMLALDVVAKLAKAHADHVTHRAPMITPATIEIARLGLRADCSRAFRELGLPKRPIEESLRDALRWFGREGYVRDATLAATLAAL